ncbi:MAG: CHC2 zinc finger domain-containing protein [Parcubacteria group bacterium]
MKYQPPKFRDKELLEIFPEAREIIPEKIGEWKIELRMNEQIIEDCLASIYGQATDDFSIWFSEEAAKTFLMPPIMEAEKHILRLKRMLSIFSPSGKRLERWQDKMEIARQYPIYEIASGNLTLKQSGDKFLSLCPFHDEKHASFFIFTKTNTFHCFGCQEHGDVIKLTMYLHGINFKEAVRMLQN